MGWSPDGYVLAIGWERGWALWSVGGRCLVWGFMDDSKVISPKYVNRIQSITTLNFRYRFDDHYMRGIRDLVHFYDPSLWCFASPYLVLGARRC